MEVTAMPENTALNQVPLEAKSPFVLRTNLGQNVRDAEARAAIVSGDMGFLHSFTTGSTVDGPGVRVVAWTTGCIWRCLYCHNPDTWTMKNGMPVTVERAADELRKYRFGLKIMSGGFTVSGGEPLFQNRFVVKMFRAAQAMGIHTALDTNGYLGERPSDEDLEAIDLVSLRLPHLQQDSGIWKESTCFRSIRWAGTNGGNSAWPTLWRTWIRPQPSWWSARAASFDRWVLMPTDSSWFERNALD
jgi:hypothetical protein